MRDHYDELGIRLIPVDFVLPQSKDAMLQATRRVIEETLATLSPNERLHLGLMDAIVSRPGVLMPWKEICALFRQYNILSLVDAAHLMGQMPVDLEKADPDFWVSNAHKWCFAPRSLAVFYVS